MNAPKIARVEINKMAEGVGFEPTEPFGSPVFKTGAIDHSTTPPICFQSVYFGRSAGLDGSSGRRGAGM